MWFYEENRRVDNSNTVVLILDKYHNNFFLLLLSFRSLKWVFLSIYIEDEIQFHSNRSLFDNLRFILKLYSNRAVSYHLTLLLTSQEHNTEWTYFNHIALSLESFNIVFLPLFEAVLLPLGTFQSYDIIKKIHTANLTIQNLM